MTTGGSWRDCQNSAPVQQPPRHPLQPGSRAAGDGPGIHRPSYHPERPTRNPSAAAARGRGTQAARRGKARLGEDRHAIANVFLSVVEMEDDGTLFTRLLEAIPEVNQTLGVPEEEYLKPGSFSRDDPSCP